MKEQLNEYIMENLDKIYRFAYNRLRNEYNAEDMTQDIILTAMRNVGNIKDSSKLDAWFWGVARNVYMQSLKPKREVPTEESMLIDISGIHYTTPESEYLKNYDISNVRRAVSYLAKMYRDVAVLYYIEEKDYNTIANELSIPLSSVKWRLNQSKNQLKEELVKMETKYMSKGYHKAIDYYINMGGRTIASHDYNGAGKALSTLLAKNICLTIYETPKTVTDISNELGVAADYIEYQIDEMVKCGAITQTSNKYQTNFPILDSKQYSEIYTDMYNAAIKNSMTILDKIYELKDEILKINFNCNKDFDKLIFMIALTVAEHTEGNIFDTDNLPFKDIDEFWYLLGVPIKRDFSINLSGGINWSEYTHHDGIREYSVPIDDNFETRNADDAKTIVELLKGEVISSESAVRLIEYNKVIKEDNKYILNVPIMYNDDYNKLLEVLQPVIEISNKIQKDILAESNKNVKRYVPSRLNSETFFTNYFAHNIINAAIVNNIKDKNIDITRDMKIWYLLKNINSHYIYINYINKG